jgi:spore germination protein YaaH
MKIKPAYLIVSVIFLTCLVFLALFNFKQFFLRPATPVIGFLPYWNVNEDLKLDFDALDQLVYFNLVVNAQGDFMTNSLNGDGNGWYHLANNQPLNQLLKNAQEKNKKILLCVASFDADVMYQVTSEAEARSNLIQNIIKKVAEKNFDGVDIDFEYFWRLNHEKTFGRNFNSFLAELKKEMERVNPALILSVDIYPKAIIEGEPYELKELINLVNQIIIMAYDYTQSNSRQAGPVAPINQEPASLFPLLKENYSIRQTLKAALKYGLAEKWILGIPLYGYQWRTADETYRSEALNYGLAETIQYKDAQKIIEEKPVRLNWSETSQSPWLSYQENGVYYQLYYENLDSLKIKVRQARLFHLGGVAFWALGYEGKEQALWQYLKN